MKRLLKNKFVVLFSIIIILSIVYFGINKAIKQYNFDNNENILIEENNEESNEESDSNEEKNNEIKENNEKYSDEEIELVTEEILNEEEQILQSSTDKIYVYITGEVNSPGVITLNDGSRIIDAINAAGGTTSKANISKVNLVYLLEDGMKINIPSDDDLKNNTEFEYITMSSGDGINDGVSGNLEIKSDGGESNSSNSGYNIGIVNINTATQTELETLPGIGPSTALKIINYRKENGKFSSIEEIKNVNGIGDSKFEALKKYITV